jgi:EAL domain
LLWLALLLGYLAGLCAAFLLLPRSALEPFYAPLAWAAAAISALGVVGLLYAYHRRDKGEMAAMGPPLAVRRDMPEPLGADTLRQSVYHGRIDALMQPLARLSPHRVALYRAVPRLLDDDGAPLATHAWRPLAARLGLIGLIDRIVLLRCARTIRQITAQGGEVCLLCDVAAGGLGEHDLVDLLDELVTTHPELGSRMVLEVGRARLDRPAGKAAARLRRLGIGLCLTRIGTGALDPAELASRGFGFVRVASPGPAAGPDTEPAQQVLAAAGLELVVDRAGGAPVPDELLERRLLLDQPFAPNRSSAA